MDSRLVVMTAVTVNLLCSDILNHKHGSGFHQLIQIAICHLVLLRKLIFFNKQESHDAVQNSIDKGQDLQNNDKTITFQSHVRSQESS